ncbi:MAG: hypothetical protein AAF928_05790 [Myxococcota bacterium]
MNILHPWFRVVARGAATASLAACLLTAASGCGSAADDFCELQCLCTRCSDRALDACKINANALADQTDIYGCSSEFEEALACADEDNDCDDNRFEIDSSCSDEFEDLSECLQDESDVNAAFLVGFGVAPTQAEDDG